MKRQPPAEEPDDLYPFLLTTGRNETFRHDGTTRICAVASLLLRPFRVSATTELDKIRSPASR
jgi:hypothetical protein